MKRMIKFLLFIFVIAGFYSTCCQAEETTIAVNETNFPDAVFRAYVQNNIDKDKNGCLTESEIRGAKKLKIYDEKSRFYDNRKIKRINLKGISYLKYLKEVDIESKQIENFDDIYTLAALKKIYVDTNRAFSLNFSNNLQLTDINISGKIIRSVDVSNNLKLKDLSLNSQKGKVIQVDLRNNSELEAVTLYIDCFKVMWPRKNSIKFLTMNTSCLKGRLTIKDFLKLYSLTAENTSVTDNFEAVRIENCPNLSEAHIIGGKKFKKAEFSNLKRIKYLQVESGKSLNQIFFKNVPNIKSLEISANKLGKVSWKALRNLRELTVSEVKNIKTLNLKKLKNLKILYWTWGSLEKINLKNNTKLEEINFEGNQLEGTLDLSGLKKLCVVYLPFNLLRGVKIGNKVYGLDISYNNIKKTLDLSYSRSLSWLNCSGNMIKKIKLSNKLKNLDELDCHDNYLKTLDLSHTNIKKIYAKDNPDLKDVYLLKKHKVHRFDKKVKKHYKRK